MIGAMARRPMPVTVEPLIARQQTIEGGQEVVVRTGADLDDHQPGRGMGHEDGQEAVAAVRRVGDEARTVTGQIDQSATVARPEGQLPRFYGKMLRKASRRRPSLPPAGADSYRVGSPVARLAAPHWRSPTAVL